LKARSVSVAGEIARVPSGQPSSRTPRVVPASHALAPDIENDDPLSSALALNGLHLLNAVPSGARLTDARAAGKIRIVFVVAVAGNARSIRAFVVLTSHALAPDIEDDGPVSSALALNGLHLLDAVPAGTRLVDAGPARTILIISAISPVGNVRRNKKHE
jgi:hypothetical protein